VADCLSVNPATPIRQALLPSADTKCRVEKRLGERDCFPAAVHQSMQCRIGPKSDPQDALGIRTSARWRCSEEAHRRLSTGASFHSGALPGRHTNGSSTTSFPVNRRPSGPSLARAASDLAAHPELLGGTHRAGQRATPESPATMRPGRIGQNRVPRSLVLPGGPAAIFEAGETAHRGDPDLAVDRCDGKRSRIGQAVFPSM